MPTTAPLMLNRRHLIDLNDLTREEIELVLRTCDELRRADEDALAERLKGRTLVNLFYENSTRTRTSFQQAGMRLGARVINVDISTSSAVKGESLLETVRTLECIGADYVVIRHPASGAHGELTAACRAHVVNAGDGMNQHPTQGLLDLLTIRDALGRLDVRIAIVGDVLHSRVARSAIAGLKKFGASIVVVGPTTFVPREFESLGIKVSHELGEGIAGADVIMALRIQHERMAKGLLPSLGEYQRRFGLNEQIVREHAPKAVIMHPGPVNVGVELSRELLDGPRSLIHRQVENGVTVRMAVLCLLKD